MYSSVWPSCRIVTSTPSTRAIVCTTALTLDRRAGCEVNRSAVAGSRGQRQKPVDRIVHIHEVDQVLAVAANR